MFETFNWEHGVAVGACVKSEATAAAEHKGECTYIRNSHTCLYMPRNTSLYGQNTIETSFDILYYYRRDKG